MGSVRIDRLDHLVPIVADLDATVEFYTRVLDMQAVTFGTGRTALTFGHSKINLHRPVTSSSRSTLSDAIEERPVERTGATGPILSVYFRDPDQNLIEVSHYA